MLSLLLICIPECIKLLLEPGCTNDLLQHQQGGECGLKGNVCASVHCYERNMIPSATVWFTCVSII